MVAAARADFLDRLAAAERRDVGSSKVHAAAPQESVASDCLARLAVAQVLVINLERRADRRALMEAQLRQLLHRPQVEFVRAHDGNDDHTAAWRTRRPVLPPPASKHRYVAACFASWESALARALEIGQFPCLVLEDDTNLVQPAAYAIGDALRVPADAELVALANGEEILPFRGNSRTWLTKSSGSIRARCHSNGAMLLPNAVGCRKLHAFLRSRPSINHVDRAMQVEFVAEAGGTVYHAIPPLYGWVESASDIVGGVRAAQSTM